MNSFDECLEVLSHMPLCPADRQRPQAALAPAQGQDWITRVVRAARPDTDHTSAILDSLLYFPNMRHLSYRISALPEGTLEAEVYQNLMQQGVQALRPS